MNEPQPEDDLKTLFQSQREVDQQRAPGFHAMRTLALGSTTSARRSPVVWPWALAGGMAVLLALAVVIFQRPPAHPQIATRETVIRELDQIDAAIQRSLATQEDLTAWQSPTDFLLHPNNTH